MLLVDDKPYSLSAAEQEKYNGKYAITVLQERIRLNDENRRVEAGAFSGILTEYFTQLNGKRSKVRYFEASTWDDSIKREVFDPVYLMIDGRAGGFEVDNNPELAWFLHNHTGWDEHPDRKPMAEGRQPLIQRNVLKQFHIRQLKDKNIAKIFDVQKARKALDAASEKWSYKEMQGIAATLVSNQSSALVLDWRIMGYKDIAPADQDALRGALIMAYDQDPLYFSRLIGGSRESQLNSAIIDLQAGENALLVFDPTSFTWSLNTGGKDAEKLCTVKKSDDPTSFLTKAALKDTAIGDKILTAAANLKETV